MILNISLSSSPVTASYLVRTRTVTADFLCLNIVPHTRHGILRIMIDTAGGGGGGGHQGVGGGGHQGVGGGGQGGVLIQRGDI